MEDSEIILIIEVLKYIGGFTLFAIAIYYFYHAYHDRKSKGLKEMILDDATPLAIMEEYNKATPYQQGNFKSSYVGVKVKWRVVFVGSYHISKIFDTGMLLFHKNQSIIPSIFFKVNYREFKIAKRIESGSTFYVTGLVKKVEGNSIYLKLLDIEKESWFVV